MGLAVRLPCRQSLKQAHQHRLTGRQTGFVEGYLDQAVGVDQGVDEVAFAEDGGGLGVGWGVRYLGGDIIFSAAFAGNILRQCGPNAPPSWRHS